MLYYFSNLLNVASEEIISQLTADKCIPVLLYGLESCHLIKSDKQSLDFAFTRMFIKLCRTSIVN